MAFSKKRCLAAWLLYGLAMIGIGLFPLVSMILLIVNDMAKFGIYNIYIGNVYMTTEFFAFVYLFIASGLFVVYGIVCVVLSFSKRVHEHTLSQSLTLKTTVFSALFGGCIGVAITCMLITVHLLGGFERYPLDDFCGGVGCVVGYIVAVLFAILYAHARRRHFTRKGLLFDIGIALFALLLGSLAISLIYEPLSLWEDQHGVINALVEWIQRNEREVF